MMGLIPGRGMGELGVEAYIAQENHFNMHSVKPITFLSFFQY